MADDRRSTDGLRVVELLRGETPCVGAWHIIEVLCERARMNRGVAGFVVIDRYSHGYRTGAPIDPRIRDAREILLRFETGLFDPASLAAEPHSICVAETADRFVLSTTLSRHPWVNQVVSAWFQALHRAPPIDHPIDANPGIPMTNVPMTNAFPAGCLG